MNKNKNLWNLGLILCLSVSANFATMAAAATFYVAPNGDDGNPGTQEQPVATVVRARDLIRKVTATGLQEDVQVLLRGGTYYLSETLTLDNRDSGTREHSITYAAYPGERVVISGGRLITGWRKTESQLWQVEIPEVKTGTWYFRELYVNDRRAIPNPRVAEIEVRRQPVGEILRGEPGHIIVEVAGPQVLSAVRRGKFHQECDGVRGPGLFLIHELEFGAERQIGTAPHGLMDLIGPHAVVKLSAHGRTDFQSREQAIRQRERYFKTIGRPEFAVVELGFDVQLADRVGFCIVDRSGAPGKHRGSPLRTGGGPNKHDGHNKVQF